MLRAKYILTLILAILTFVIIINTASAGDEDNPEIEDEDDIIPDTLMPDRDIDKAWFGNETLETFQTTLQVKNLGPEPIIPLPFEFLWKEYTAEYYVFFTNEEDGEEYYSMARFEFQLNATIPSMHYYIGKGNETLAETYGYVDFGNNTLTVVVFKSVIGNISRGSNLTNTYAESKAVLGLLTGTTQELDRDRAPNEGYGKNYTITDGKVINDVSLQVSPSSLEVENGESAEYNITVQNHGEYKRDISLSLSGIPNVYWSAQLSKTLITLTPYNSTYVILTVIPNGAEDGEKAVITVTETHTQDGILVTSEITTTTTAIIPTYYGVELSFDKEEMERKGKISPNRFETYLIVIRNTGNAGQDTFDLSIGFYPEGWKVSLNKNSITLNVSDFDIITVTVEVPKSAKHGDEASIKITAVSRSDVTISDFVYLNITVSEKGDFGQHYPDNENKNKNIIDTTLLFIIIGVAVASALAITTAFIFYRR